MRIPKIKQSENIVKKAIKEYLEYDGWTVYRINNAGTKRKDKNDREFYTFAGTSGVFDLYCVKPREYDMWIEIKATGKKPSQAQLDFMQLVNSVPSRCAFWSDSFDRFLKIYTEIKDVYGVPK